MGMKSNLDKSIERAHVAVGIDQMPCHNQMCWLVLDSVT